MSRVLEEFPSIALRVFYLSPEFKEFHAVYKTGEIQDLVDRIGKSAAVAILEGTGTYTKSGLLIAFIMANRTQLPPPRSPVT